MDEMKRIWTIESWARRWVCDHSLDATTFHIGLFLALKSEVGVAIPNSADATEGIHMSEATVEQGIRQLLDAGAISKMDNGYRLNIERSAA